MSTRSENYELMVMSIGWVARSSVVECLRRVCESSHFKFRFKKTRLSQHWTLGLQKKTMALSEVQSALVMRLHIHLHPSYTELSTSFILKHLTQPNRG